jgi:hypothetical protein
MTFISVKPSDIESFTIVTNPRRSFTSSSLGVTGSVNVYARRSHTEKDMLISPAFLDVIHGDNDINSELYTLQSSGRTVRNALSRSLSDTFGPMMESYLRKVNSSSINLRKQKVIDIKRFTPSYMFTKNTMKKLVVKDILMKHYKTSYPSAHWAYTNYNSLNFFTASNLPTSSVLLYPNIQTDDATFHEGYVSGAYSLSGAFSFDFYINPRYQQNEPDKEFKAGTIFHLSSSYAVSLVSGSAKDHNGKSVGFRLKLQLSHSADVKPSLATNGNYPNDLIFLSDDNSLSWNHWHHVVIRWGTNLVNNGTGSFNIDSVDKGTFVVPSSSITPRLFNAATFANPDVLCIGNYYEGNNTGVNSQAYFFANDPSQRDGLQQLINDVGGIDEPTYYSFNHPLNAELHDLSIKRYHMSDLDVEVSASVGPKSLDNWTAFYLPVFFVQDSPFRKFVGSYGGILQTPFFEVDGVTDDPFNVAMSFGVAGHYINIENYLRDFASNVFPRTHHMTGTAIPYSTTAQPANDFLYADPFVCRRNLLIMPCDDGLFVPSYELLASESINSSYVDDLGVEDLSLIHLDGLLSTSSLIFGEDFTSTSSGQTFINEAVGFTPENPGSAPGGSYRNYIKNLNLTVLSGTFDAGVQTGAPLTIYQRTKDSSSNQVTFFDVSNLYYGMRILPGTFEMYDSNLSGSNGSIGIKLKDDGNGNIYRADCLTSASTWNSVGNIFYHEGIIVIKSPHLFFYGKEQFEISLKGEQNIHSMKLEILAESSHLNSSSNPSFINLPASGYVTDKDPNYVYITNINFHDENMNVVMKTQLAQPILKRHTDKILFKVGMDF